MQKHIPTTHVIAGAALAFAFTFTAQAQNNRSFVDTTGIDTNNCSASAYCRTFARALAMTNSGGEIVVVNSGGYGPFTIAQAVTITAIGVDAAITAAPDGAAITVNTTGNVTITGLNLSGGLVANNGVLVTQVGALRLYNMQMQNFVNAGIDFEATGNLAVDDSKINDSGSGLVQAAGQIYVRNTEFDNNAIGAISGGGTMTIADSSAHYNGVGFYASGGSVALYNDRVVSNHTGLDADNSGTLYFADCLISNNSTDSYDILGGTMFGSSPGTSLFTPGQPTSGTLGAAITLK